jgi:hypothetical protein
MDSGGGGKRDPSLDEEAKRIRKIITNEQTKPLEVSRDFILNYEKKEAMDSEKLANQVERHIETLRTIRGKLEERVELKSRINEYRDWKKGFHEKKAAIMNGKTLQSYSADSQSVGGGGTGGAGRGGSGGSTRGTTGGGGSGATGGGKDLAVVLDSLNKLAQLEARITSLERDHDNMYEQMKGSEVATQQEAEKTALEFKKKRAVDPLQRGAAMKTVYTLKTKKVPVSKGIKLPKGTFLTAVERDKDTNNLRSTPLPSFPLSLPLTSLLPPLTYFTSLTHLSPPPPAFCVLSCPPVSCPPASCPPASCPAVSASVCCCVCLCVLLYLCRPVWCLCRVCVVSVSCVGMLVIVRSNVN